MQPYFFPYLGYYSLLKQVDEFILFDTVQFIRHGWIERNRILKPNEGVQYVSVPLVKASRETLIKDMRIRNNEDWKKKLFQQLEHYKRRAPFYSETISVLEEALNCQDDSITHLNQKTLVTVCDYLGIKKKIEIFSEMNLTIEKVNAPDEWALNICKALGNVEEYWNLSGGRSFFDPSKYETAGIKLFFHALNGKTYSQRRKTFEPSLSIIDVMMFNSKEKIDLMLDDYELLKR
jgi:hypothetical protein